MSTIFGPIGREILRVTQDGLVTFAADVTQEELKEALARTLKAGLAWPPEPLSDSEVLRRAATIMLTWPNHGPYTQSGRGLIAVQELSWLADHLEATSTVDRARLAGELEDTATGGPGAGLEP